MITWIIVLFSVYIGLLVFASVKAFKRNRSSQEFMLAGSSLGVILGVISAVRKDRLADNLIRIVSMSGVSMPIFWLAILLQLALA